MTEIPIENIYHLLCYAWDRLEQRDLVAVSELDTHEQVDLLASVLSAGTERLLKSGLDRGYMETDEETRTIRGRVDFNTSLKRFLFKKARAQCTYDVLSADVLHNRILKSTMLRLTRVETLSPELKRRLIKNADRMGAVTAIRLTAQVFSRVQLHSNNAFYAFLMQICELAYHSTLVDEKTGDVRFRDFFRDPNRMWRLFQAFLFNFYRVHEEQTGYRARSEPRIEWLVDEAEGDQEEFGPDSSLLPEMHPDIILRSDEKTIVMDAKFHPHTLQEHFGKQTIKSGDLYQIFAYLKNLEGEDGNDSDARGILVYPTIDHDVYSTYNLHGHAVIVATVNLNHKWHRVEERLHSVLDCR